MMDLKNLKRAIEQVAELDASTESATDRPDVAVAVGV